MPKKSRNVPCHTGSGHNEGSRRKGQDHQHGSLGNISLIFDVCHKTKSKDNVGEKYEVNEEYDVNEKYEVRLNKEYDIGERYKTR